MLAHDLCLPHRGELRRCASSSPSISRGAHCSAKGRGQKRSSRGRGLLLGAPLRPAEEGDPILEEISKDYNPVEAVSVVQWYPGHIAKAEKELREHLAAVDVVIEVRDGRIPMSTRHPQIPEWIKGKPRVMVLNRMDMIPRAAMEAWSRFFRERGHEVVWTNANKGDGIPKVTAAALDCSAFLNEKRRKRGLRPRPVRGVVIGFPNVGKSALINRILGRRVADSAPRPGVTRVLRWMRIGGDLDLLDAPGIIPMSFKDQKAAQRLAICNDIGEASYVASMIAARLLREMQELPESDQLLSRIETRYGMTLKDGNEEEYVYALADKLFNSEPERAGQRILKDFRELRFGKACLEMPQDYVDVVV